MIVQPQCHCKQIAGNGSPSLNLAQWRPLRQPGASTPRSRLSSQLPSASHIACQAAAVETQPELKVEQMEPLGDRVLVKPAEESEMTEGGIIVSGSTQAGMGIADAVIGEVLAVGTEVELKVKKGDTVIYSKYSSSDIPAPDGGNVTFVAQKSLLAILS